jgi:lambda family phage tail tape measure protein
MATPISKVTLTLDNRDYISGLNQASQQTKSFGTEASAAFNRADAASNKLNLSATNLTGGLVRLRGTLATIGLGAFAASALQSADAVADLADSTQLSIGKILEFQKALRLAGGDANDAGKALGAFYASIDEANQGSDKTQETFRRLGVSLKDLRTLSEEDLLDKTVKGFQNISDPIQRSTALTNLFGKAMRTVDPARLGTELENLRGTLAAQEGSTNDAADAIEAFENLVSGLKGAVVLAIQPLLQFFGVMKDSDIDVRALAGLIQNLAAAYVALRIAAFGAAIAQAAVGKGIRGGAAGLLTGAAAAALTYKGIQELMDQIGAGPQPGTQGPAAGLGANATMEQALAEERRIRERRNRDSERRNREQQIGKELQAQLDSVNGLVDGYRRAAQSNMDRYTTEVDLLGKTEYEQELIKGTAEIEKRYADQLAALEDKKKGAKGATLALIQKSISELDGLRTSELDIFEITRKQTFEYKQQQEDIKRINDQIEKQLENQQKLGDILRGINDQKVDIQFEQSLKGLAPLQKEITKIQENARKGALEAGRSFSAAFDNEDGLTPERAQELANGLAEIAQGYRDIAQSQIEAAVGFDPLKQAFEDFKNNAMDTGKNMADTFGTFTSGMEDAFVQFAQTGKLSFKNLADSIIADLIRIAVRRAIVAAIGGPLGSLFGFANGGPVMGATPIIVGERGPELFVPQSAGKIINNSTLKGSGSNNMGTGGSPTVVNYNIQAVDAASFRSLVAKDPSFIYAVTEQGRRSQPTRSR